MFCVLWRSLLAVEGADNTFKASLVTATPTCGTAIERSFWSSSSSDSTSSNGHQQS
jgi:hypothetical protein